ncbi:MAG: glycosyltransferase [Marinospirillum sp.]|uniref:glycosyltransferase n=1 Tax=Marinospirillum sp. TaxID=2183934 RepID=UPI001A044052|nr:glycosyltransferase [Marinospirillum sp.]MBE0505982.1 glycosyltransferase [Marinospirillum sp.]
MANKKMVSVIIPTYHDWDRLALCIEALKSQTYPAETFEVIIVNNDPDDAASELNLTENFQLISESSPGSYAARNAGLAIARGEIVAFTDSDCIPDKDWIINSVKHLEEGAERLAGRVELFFKSKRHSISEIYEKAFSFDQELTASYGGAITANMITWKKNFDIVGLFDSNLMSGGDNEWAGRAEAMGIKVVYAKDAIVYHPARDSIKDLIKKKRRVAAGLLRVNRLSILDILAKGFFVNPSRAIRAYRIGRVSFFESLVSFFVLFFLKLVQTLEQLLLVLSLKKDER